MVAALPHSSISRALLGTLQVLVALPLLLVAVGLLAGVLPSFFQYESFVVQSGSMVPALAAGDLAVAAPARPQDLMVGTIIVYRTAENPAVVVTHRLVAVGVNPDGSLSFQTRGDANDTADRVRVNEQALIGRVVYSLPKIGYLAAFAKQPEGRLLLIVLPALLLALDYVVGARRRARDERAYEHVESVTAVELVAQAERAVADGQPDAALDLLDKAIAADPRLEAPWLLKAVLLPDGAERGACLQVALTINPTSERLKAALPPATASSSAAGA